MFRSLGFLWLLLMGSNVFAGASFEYCGEEAAACPLYGSHVFSSRCVLCHGTDGHGEGMLPMTLKGYPDTNLLSNISTNDYAELTEVIKRGSGLPGVSEEMPPWGDELTVTQLESVVQFVQLLRSNTKQALSMLRTQARKVEPSMRVGRVIYKTRCSMCHGVDGKGDGRMARIIKNPPPFNLTLSSAPDEYLQKIIAKGGEAVGRSSRMPPWGKDLSKPEIKSVILYIKSLRE